MAMRSLWIANIINIILDPLLIFGVGPFPELGVMGAAVATTIGRSIGVAFQLYILFNGNRVIQLVKSYFKPNRAIIQKMLDIAATGTGQYLIASASWIFMMRLVSEYGTGAVNGYGLAVRIIIFTILPAWGIANAGATMMGQNLGAKRPDRAETAVWRASWYNALFLFIISIVFFLAAEDLIAAFNDDVDVISIGAQGLQIFAIGYIFFGFGMVINQAFGGAGDTRTPTVINFVSFWLVQIPLAYYLTQFAKWGISGVFWAVVISEVILALLAVWIFRMGRWKTVKL
jgi:putative MATE family efflux protein